jgi:hypothetical protein
VRPAFTSVGHLVAASFGLAFVVANSTSLPAGVRVVVCVVAAVAAAVVLAGFLRTSRGRPAGTAVAGFTRGFWAVVAVEVVALFGGLAVLRTVEPAAALGWIALVVGLHFVPLSRLWVDGRTQLLGIAVAMTVLGLVGLGLAFGTHRPTVVALVSGVGSGVVLLGWTCAAAVRTLAADGSG